MDQALRKQQLPIGLGYLELAWKTNKNKKKKKAKLRAFSDRALYF